MGKTIIVSNRLPVRIVEEDGKLSTKQSEGGLATGLGSIYTEGNNIWIGWPGMDIKPANQKDVSAQLNTLKLIPVYLSKEDINQYYEGFSNETLWPVFHYMTPYARYQKEYWNFYKSVNEKFRDVILQYVQPGDTLWIHDYQLLLLPALMRDAIPDITIGFFQHIPFPSFELFRSIPWRSELLQGLLGADLVGFHTYDDARHFTSSCLRILQIQATSNTLYYNDRTIVAESFPMGIDYKKFSTLVETEAVQQELALLRSNFGSVRIILSIDRLDYSKGIIQRLQAFDLLLNEHPEYKEKVSLYMIVVPSRDTVPMYKQLRDDIDKTAGNINARFRTNNWTPVNYFYRSFPVETLSALYHAADVCLVTPLRDGMNLVCKEYIASRANDDGVLILSEMAGAAKELIDAVIVNPNNVVQMSEAIVDALNMPMDIQQQKMRQMRHLVSRYDIAYWVNSFVEKLENVKRTQEALTTKYIGARTFQYIKNRYAIAHKRLFLLDYDGTLVDFNVNINKAYPDKELIHILNELAKDDRNHIVIISGRKHTTLEEWFGGMKLDLVGEHGVWHKEYKGKWKEMKGLTTDWKEHIMPILRIYTERTPGAFIEDKSYSLVWHYRKADDELGETRAHELVNNLKYMLNDWGLSLLLGNKVVEIRNIEVNKGKAALHYIREANYDFVLAVGDDITDEDMFKAIKDEAITIKVNSNLSAAQYYLQGYQEVRVLLKSLIPKQFLTRVIDGFTSIFPYHPFTKQKKG